MEQLKQKEMKRQKSRLYEIVQPASGYWFPIVYGLKVCGNFPCTDEPRLKLQIGDKVLVTRWRKYVLLALLTDQHNSCLFIM